MILPDIYIDFIAQCRKDFPKSLLGTDFAFESAKLKETALDLLSENNIELFLNEDDFVFFNHQGYVFGYFRADGNSNPDVYIFSEVDLQKKNMGPLSRYLREEI